MMIPAYYPQMKAVADEWLGEGLTFPVIHCEKEVGTLLSDAAAAKSAGESAAADVLLRQALDDFKKNCEMGAMAGSGRMVLHLWGGLNSDCCNKNTINIILFFYIIKIFSVIFKYFICIFVIF